MKYKIKNYKFSILLILILILFNLRNINLLTLPSILFDEFGYWASAALWKGYDWSGIVSKYSPYYSYGYSSVLFLAMSLAENPQMQHIIAIIFNIMFIICIYLMANYIASRIFPKVEKNINNLSSFIICFYPSVLYNSQVAWSEIFLAFLFWISIIVVVKIYEKNTNFYCIVFALILMLMYITHQRSLGVMVSGCIIIFLLLYLKKISGVNLLIFFSVLILGWVLQGILKNHVLSNLYLNSNLNLDSLVQTPVGNSLISANDFKGQIGKILYLFTIEGLGNFFISFLGKLYYFGLASLFVGYEGIRLLIYSLKGIFRKNIEYEFKHVLFAFILLSFISTVFVSALFTIYPGRIDTVAYGRYTDWLVLPLLLVGFVSSLNSLDKKLFKRYLIYTIAISSFTIVFQSYIDKNKISGFFASCSPIMTYFRNKDPNNLILLMNVFLITISIILCLGFMQKRKIQRGIFVTIFTICIWLKITKPAIDELIHIRYESGVLPIAEFILDSGQENAYYIFDNEKKFFREDAYTGNIQFLLKDKSVRCISIDRTEEIKGKYAIIGKSYELPGKIVTDYEIVYDNWLYRIIKIK